jgi:hypothetical protein
MIWLSVLFPRKTSFKTQNASFYWKPANKKKQTKKQKKKQTNKTNKKQ